MAPSGTVYPTSAVDQEPVISKGKPSPTSASEHPMRSTVADAGITSFQTVEWEHEYSAHNYHPLPVVFSRALGAKVWDPEGTEYLDFLSACTCSHLSVHY